MTMGKPVPVKVGTAHAGPGELATGAIHAGLRDGLTRVDLQAKNLPVPS
jgi:hypothetical protein